MKTRQREKCEYIQSEWSWGIQQAIRQTGLGNCGPSCHGQLHLIRRFQAETAAGQGHNPTYHSKGPRQSTQDPGEPPLQDLVYILLLYYIDSSLINEEEDQTRREMMEAARGGYPSPEVKRFTRRVLLEGQYGWLNCRVATLRFQYRWRMIVWSIRAANTLWDRNPFGVRSRRSLEARKFDSA